MMQVAHPGFADPVRDAQRGFRALLDAMARPGTWHRIGTPDETPAPLDRATAAVLLTLLDADTPFWAAPEFSPCRDWLRFHTGAPAAAHIGDAAFVLCASLPDLASLNAGTDAGPEDSATLILQNAERNGHDWRLDGPGLAASCTVRIGGLPDDFAGRWAANHALFPRGIDLVVCAGDTLLALPRSTHVTEG